MLSVADVAALVGPTALARALDYVEQGRVVSVARSGDGSRVVGHVEGSAREPYVAVVELSAAGVPRSSRCSCPVGRDCKHVAATLLAYRERSDEPAPDAAPAPATAEWEDALGAVLAEVEGARGAQGGSGGAAAWRGTRSSRWQDVALQVELQEPRPGARRAPTGPAVPRLALRPVVRGASGRWVRTGISWRELRYRRGTAPDAHLDVLRSLYGLASGTRESSFAFADPDWVHADDLPGSALWALLADAERARLPLVGTDRAQSTVRLTVARSELVVARAAGGGLALRADVAVGADVADAAVGPDAADAAPSARREVHPVGVPAAGVVAVAPEPGARRGTGGAAGPAGASRASGALVLAPLARPLDETALALLGRAVPLAVPAADAHRFLARVLPALAARFDALRLEGVTLPDPPRPVLVLQVTRYAEHVARVVWRWRYVTGNPPQVDAEHAAGRPGAPSAHDTPGRDAAREAAVLARLADVLPLPVRDTELRGLATADLLSGGLAGLVGATAPADGAPGPDLVVEVRVDPGADDAVDYRAATDVDVSVQVTAPPGGRDWFDLGVIVHAGGRSIPFQTIFRALATGQTRVLLPDGLHFSLDDERFDRLRAILEESRDLQDTMGGPLRVGRYQAELFDELERLGVLDDQAAAWRASVGALAGGARPGPVDVPAGLRAELRPYQREGFEWLVFLAEHRLGGVLADDMGLGKTVQTLAAVQHAHDRAAAAGTRPAPVLVVTPTSVVDNWLAEARRFVPGLSAVAVRGTRAKRREPLADTVAGADVVVTSYALFRLDADEYRSLAWSALVLDEAQLVKNRQSVAYRCARELDAPVKLALTGTPLENTLMELWSVLSITSPGLFPDPHRFADVYAGPIEREGHADRLDALRRRVAPFMLRRTKEQVATELPARAEHVTEVTLDARHRRVYDQYLQRERRNVLGLVDELDSNRFKVFRSLTLLRQAALDVSLVDEAHAGVPSSKLDVLFEMLDDALAEGHTVLVFSQFTRLLAKVRARLDAAGVDHAYLDGRTRRRAEQVERFTSGEVPVFLVSLKAGGFGLNLTAADYCVLLDPWWNPAAEAQAVDRAHRIGQTRTVMVYRLVASDTIEDKVMSLKAAKSVLFRSVLDGGTTATAGLTADDVRALLE